MKRVCVGEGKCLLVIIPLLFSVSRQSTIFTRSFPICPTLSWKSLYRTFGKNRGTTNSNSQVSYTSIGSSGIGEYINVWYDPVWWEDLLKYFYVCIIYKFIKIGIKRWKLLQIINKEVLGQIVCTLKSSKYDKWNMLTS